MKMIPLSVPYLSGNEWNYVKDCIETGWVSSAGSYVTQFENQVAEFAGSKYGVAVVNGTSALHLALHVIGVTRGDLVIVPNITFIASANAATYTGAEPVFIDVDPDTWQMDLNLLEQFFSEQCTQRGNTLYHTSDDGTEKRVAAIMPVHVLGNLCDMHKLVTLSEKYNVPIVEDASESLGSYYDKKHSGTFGKLGVFSFNGNKIITTGGGGIIVTDDEALAKRAKHLSTQSKVNPETYYHDEIGFNYRLVNVLAAIGVAQMEQLTDFIARKKHIDNYYRTHLKDLEIAFQKVEDNVDPNCWLFTFSSKNKDQILSTLKQNKIIARPFWTPMNQLPMFAESIYIQENDFSKQVHENCLSIPCSVNLTDAELDRVTSCIFSAL